MGVVGLSGGESARAAESSQPSAPAAAVRQYIASLDRHDGAAACRLFSPQLRAFEIRWDTPVSGRNSCAGPVAAHFRDYYSRHRWASARILRVGSTQVDAVRGVAAVHLTMSHHYACASTDPTPEPCHQGSYVRTDIVYLMRVSAVWKIVKPRH
jgi:hypothetical protein